MVLVEVLRFGTKLMSAGTAGSEVMLTSNNDGALISITAAPMVSGSAYFRLFSGPQGTIFADEDVVFDGFVHVGARRTAALVGEEMGSCTAKGILNVAGGSSALSFWGVE